MTPERVSVVIAAFNEAEAVGPVVAGIRALVPEVELIVVDDGSADGTGDVAEAAGARVIRHRRNMGQGASLKTGALAASREHVLFCDADGQHTAEDVRRIIDAFDDCDMCVGARSRDSHAPASRALGKAVLCWAANVLAGERIPDLNSGLRMVRRSVLVKYLHLLPSRFSFSTMLTFALLKANHRICWEPIVARRRVGQSTVRQVRHGSEALLLILRITVLFEPLKVFLSVAGALLLLSLLSLGIDLVYGDGGIGDVTVLMSTAALLVFMFGLLCDQVSALRRELHE